MKDRNAYILVAFVKIYELSIGIYFLGLAIVWDVLTSDKDLRLKDEDFE